MRRPLQAVRGRLRVGATIALAAVALAVRGKMRVHAKTRAAPHGMISLATAHDLAATRRIVRSWDERTRRKADLNLRLDPLFSIAWTMAIALADLLAARKLQTLGWPAARLGVPLAWGQGLAALLATTKDLALLALLRGSSTRLLPQVARWCALPEIGLKSVGLAYGVVGAAGWLAVRRGNRPARWPRPVPGHAL